MARKPNQQAKVNEPEQINITPDIVKAFFPYSNDGGVYSSPRILIPKARIRWAHLHEPRGYQDGDKKYGTTLMLMKNYEPHKIVKRIIEHQAGILKTEHEVRDEKFYINIKDGCEYADLKQQQVLNKKMGGDGKPAILHDEMRGHWFFSANGIARKTVDGYKVPIPVSVYDTSHTRLEFLDLQLSLPLELRYKKIPDEEYGDRHDIAAMIQNNRDRIGEITKDGMYVDAVVRIFVASNFGTLSLTLDSVYGCGEGELIKSVNVSPIPLKILNAFAPPTSLPNQNTPSKTLPQKTQIDPRTGEVLNTKLSPDADLHEVVETLMYEDEDCDLFENDPTSEVAK